jgi:hypothetical protein
VNRVLSSAPSARPGSRGSLGGETERAEDVGGCPARSHPPRRASDRSTGPSGGCCGCLELRVRRRLRPPRWRCGAGERPRTRLRARDELTAGPRSAGGPEVVTGPETHASLMASLTAATSREPGAGSAAVIGWFPHTGGCGSGNRRRVEGERRAHAPPQPTTIRRHGAATIVRTCQIRR